MLVPWRVQNILKTYVCLIRIGIGQKRFGCGGTDIVLREVVYIVVIYLFEICFHWFPQRN